MDEMKKYIIEFSEDPHTIRLMKIKNGDKFPITEFKAVSPYIEPDTEKIRKEAYEDGYKIAKIQCNIQAEKDMREVGERHYQSGLSDAWEAARKIANMPYGEEEKAFGSGGWAFIEKHTASEAIEKIRQYEQEQEAFHVGDEFVNENGDKFVIITMDGKEIDRYVDKYGKTYVMNVKYSKMRKTGRHFPEIAEVLAKMKES